MIFSDGEFHIILNRRNLEICEHSTFLSYSRNWRLSKLGIAKFKITETKKLMKPIAQLTFLNISN